MRSQQKSNDQTQQIFWTCTYHKNQRITNFCLAQQCLKPLCPQCVKQHLQQHTQHNTFGVFDVINNIVTATKKQLNDKLNRNNKRKIIVKNLSINKDKEIQDAVKTIRNYKQELFNVLEQKFNEIQENFKSEIVNQQQSFLQQAQRHNILLNNFIDSSKKNLDTINTNNGIQTIINTMTELKRKQATIEQSFEIIQEKSLTKYVVKTNPNFLKQLSDICQTQVELKTIEIEAFQLVNSIIQKQTFNEKSVNIDELKKVEKRLLNLNLIDERSQQNIVIKQDGLIEKLSKTTERLQNEFNIIARKVGPNEIYNTYR